LQRPHNPDEHENGSGNVRTRAILSARLITLLTPLLVDIDKPDLRLLKDKTQMLAIRTMEECFSTIANIASASISSPYCSRVSGS
jgi:hypothetical protein